MELTSTYNLTHSTKVFINDSLIVCSLFSKSSKALLFLFIQSVWNRHIGVALQSFFHFLPTKESGQLNKVPLTEECNTKTTPNIEKINYHRILAIRQWKSK